MTTTDLPARYCTMRVEIPVTFEVTIDTESELGRQAYEHLRAHPNEIPGWLNAALAVAFRLANARGDDAAPAISIDATVPGKWRDLITTTLGG